MTNGKWQMPCSSAIIARVPHEQMSEASDKVRGLSDLPQFPLPVVLFPGVPLPLHIFEPRYRQMLEDIRLSKNVFGLAYFDSTSSENEVPPAGHVGCVAEVTEVQTFPTDAQTFSRLALLDTVSNLISSVAIHTWLPT